MSSPVERLRVIVEDATLAQPREDLRAVLDAAEKAVGALLEVGTVLTETTDHAQDPEDGLPCMCDKALCGLLNVTNPIDAALAALRDAGFGEEK